MTLTGDEASSVIIDIGSRYLRVGYSGDERPSVVICSSVGVLPDERLLFGDLAVACARDGLEVKPTVSCSEILEWRLLERLLDHGVRERLGVRWADHPVLLVDNAAWSHETREQLVQMIFDRFDVPALFLGRTPVLAAFAMGKHTALVVDCGASAIRVSPVFDGYLIKAGALHQTLLGGDAISEQARLMLVGEAKIGSIHIPQQIEHRVPVELGQPAKAELRMLPNLTDSFLAHQTRLVLDDFKETVAQISETPFNDRELAMRPPKFYEFPDGFNRNFGLDRYRLGEQIFNPGNFRYKIDPDSAAAAAAPAPVVGLAELIHKSLQQCDVEVRNALVGNLVLTGGGSSFNGLSERLNYELNRLPAYGRVRVQIGATSQERRYGPWIGGSILASLSTFQQLWLTKQEYKEHGAAYIDRKCP